MHPPCASRRKYLQRGVTLAEVLVAMAASMLLLFGLIALDGARSRISQQTRRNAGVVYPDRNEAALLQLHISKRLDAADQFCIPDGGGGCEPSGNGGTVLQVRRIVMSGACALGVPAPACFSDPNNFVWDQYMRQGNSVVFLTNTRTVGGGSDCTSTTVLVSDNVTNIVFTVTNNRVNFMEFWTAPDNGETVQFSGEVVVHAGTANAAEIPAGSNVSTPPPPCP